MIGAAQDVKIKVEQRPETKYRKMSHTLEKEDTKGVPKISTGLSGSPSLVKEEEVSKESACIAEVQDIEGSSCDEDGDAAFILNPQTGMQYQGSRST